MKCAEASELLSAFVDGELDDRDESRLNAHVAQCRNCRSRLESLRALGARLDAVMQEPMDAPDASDWVMSRLPVRQRPVMLRWTLAAAGICLLALVSWHLFLGPESVQRTAQRGPKSSPDQPLVLSQRTPTPPLVVREQKPLAIVPHRVTERVAFTHMRRQHRHPPIRPNAARHEPAPAGILLRAPQLTVTTEATEGRVERKIVVTGGDIRVCISKVTEVVLPPNPDAATIVRPDLKVRIGESPTINVTGG